MIDLTAYLNNMGRPGTPAVLLIKEGVIAVGVLAYPPEYPDWLCEPIALETLGLTLNQLVVGSSPTGVTQENQVSLTSDQSVSPSSTENGEA